MPLLLGGDEFRRTQGGNNNAYCQDNDTSWYDWSRLEQHEDIFRFTRGLIAFRRTHPILSTERFYTDAEIQWFGPSGDVPQWTDPKEKQLACLVHEREHCLLYLMFNASGEGAAFDLTRPPNGARWHLAVDTRRDAPHDLCVADQELPLDDSPAYPVGPRSSVILVARPPT